MTSDDRSLSTINDLFSRVATPTDEEVDQFILFCIGRIEHLLETDAARTVFGKLQKTGDTWPDLAEQVNLEVNDAAVRNRHAAKALAHAVCHLVRPGDRNFDDDRIENARLVALYCQWAISDFESPPYPIVNEAVSQSDGDGAKWLLQHVKNREQSAQLNFISLKLPHWFGGS